MKRLTTRVLFCPPPPQHTVGKRQISDSVCSYIVYFLTVYWCHCKRKTKVHMQADQHLFFSRIDCAIQNFKPLANFSGCTAGSVSDLVRKPKTVFLETELIWSLFILTLCIFLLYVGAVVSKYMILIIFLFIAGNTTM